MKILTEKEKIKRIEALKKKIEKGYQLSLNVGTYRGNLLLIDVETIGWYKCPKEICLPFDISYKVINNITAEELDFGTILTKEYYYDKDCQETQFCRVKIPTLYKNKIDKEKTTQILSIEKIHTFFTNLINTYNVKIIVAYNGAFDYEALNRLFYQNNYSSPFAKLNFLDLGTLACHALKNDNNFKRFCKLNNYHYTDKKNNELCKIPVEVLGKYILGKSFTEQHTGLKDLEVELLLYKYFKMMLSLSNEKTLLKLNRKMFSDKELVTC